MTDEAPALVAAGGPPDPVEPPRTRMGLVAWGVSILLHAALIAALADLSDRLGSEPEDEVISAEWVIDAPLKEAVAVNAADEAPRAELPALAPEVGDATRLALLPGAATTVPEVPAAPAAASVPASDMLVPAGAPEDAAPARHSLEAHRPLAEPPMLPTTTGRDLPVPPALAALLDAPAVAGPAQPAAAVPPEALPQAGQPPPLQAPPASGLAPVPATALASLSAPGELAPVADLATARRAGAPENLPVSPATADAVARPPESGPADARPVQPESALSVLVPPALPPQEADPRRAIEAETLDLACGRVAATFTPDDGTVVLSGHLRSAQDRVAFVARLSALAGVRRVADRDLHVVGEPYCRVLGFLGGPGLMRSEDQRQDAAAIGQPAQAGVVHIRAGRPLELQLGGPDFPSFVYVDYFTADGRVYHLLPAPGSKENRLGPDERLALGGRNGRGLKATIGPPFGLDMVVAVAATRPVFAQSRPVAEDAALYLAEFEAALAAARRDEGLRIEYSYFLIRTTPD